ncbi:uncharacterized protein [Nerophis lumbriciformis]|uniref:uncharacterized protein n=1 Tax=Nerophis lumbriciformis TaxID=546530 RepID=UPI002AE01D95|nr:uncharacterized protein LOC133607275 [Nerophis lumbriciformis]
MEEQNIMEILSGDHLVCWKFCSHMLKQRQRNSYRATSQLHEITEAPALTSSPALHSPVPASTGSPTSQNPAPANTRPLAVRSPSSAYYCSAQTLRLWHHLFLFLANSVENLHGGCLATTLLHASICPSLAPVPAAPVSSSSQVECLGSIWGCSARLPPASSPVGTPPAGGSAADATSSCAFSNSTTDGSFSSATSGCAADATSSSATSSSATSSVSTADAIFNFASSKSIADGTFISSTSGSVTDATSSSAFCGSLADAIFSFASSGSPADATFSSASDGSALDATATASSTSSSATDVANPRTSPLPTAAIPGTWVLVSMAYVYLHCRHGCGRRPRQQQQRPGFRHGSCATRPSSSPAAAAFHSPSPPVASRFLPCGLLAETHLHSVPPLNSALDVDQGGGSPLQTHPTGPQQVICPLSVFVDCCSSDAKTSRSKGASGEYFPSCCIVDGTRRPNAGLLFVGVDVFYREMIHGRINDGVTFFCLAEVKSRRGGRNQARLWRYLT